MYDPTISNSDLIELYKDKEEVIDGNTTILGFLFNPSIIDYRPFTDATDPLLSSCCLDCIYEDYLDKYLSKDLLNSATIIPLNDSTLDHYNYEWSCDLCGSTTFHRPTEPISISAWGDILLPGESSCL